MPAVVDRPTIFALSSGRPPAAIAVVRLSGPRAFAALRTLTGKPLPPLRAMTLATLSDPRSQIALDRALVVRFAASASVTGEDVVELHLHGGTAVVAAVLDALGALPGLRLAKPGEFTRRAFNNGKLDLNAVEGLADLIAATTEGQRISALEATRGGLRDAVERWRRVLLDALASIESELDFAEEQDDVEPSAAIAAQVSEVAAVEAEIADRLAQAHRGERLRDGLVVAIVGEPNVGKSSLLNSLVMRDAAIVSPSPGTTRDLIEVHVELDGLPLTLIDTAGLRDDVPDPSEREGIARARSRAATADLVLHVCTALPDVRLGQLVINKIDLTTESAGLRDTTLYVSAATGAGLNELKDWLANWARSLLRAGEPVLVSSRRQIDASQDTRSYLQELAITDQLVLKAESLQHALKALARLAGNHLNEDVLDAIFSRFCIGK